MSHEPAPSLSAYLVVCTAPNQSCASCITRYSLSSTEETVIGREASCQISIDSEQYPAVSRYHAKIQPSNEVAGISWHLCDLNAANGTYLNGQRLQGGTVLKSGDRIMLSKGGVEFIFECEVILPSINSEPSIVVEPSPGSDLSIPSAESSPLLTAPTLPPTQPVTKSTDAARSLWDMAREECVTLSGHSELVRAVAFSADGRFLASGSADKTIKIWDLASQKEVQTLSGQKLAIASVAFSPDHKLLASGSADKTIRIWDLASAESHQQLLGHGMGVIAVTFSPDHKLLASGSADKTIKIWDLASDENVRTLVGHKMGVNAVAFSPDAHLLATGGADRTVKLWKVETGEEAVTLPAFRSAINAVFFSPNGKILAIATEDKMVRLWSLESEQEIRVFSGYSWQVGGLAVSPDGQRLACGSEDNTIRVWNP